RDRKFTGTVTEIANTAKTTQAGMQQEATKFEVRIRVSEKEVFRPGMSVTANIETRYRTNVLTVPIQSVTTRVPKKPEAKNKAGETATLTAAEKKKQDEANKPVEVVFLMESRCAKMVKVKRGLSDESYVEIEDGVSEGQEVVSGGYKAINRELEDGRKIKIGPPKSETAGEKK
ncbi:MAG TPA: efflux RND transporter periplasmic adaptor subunit, partial [Verrucomicrobiae bacterium]